VCDAVTVGVLYNDCVIVGVIVDVGDTVGELVGVTVGVGDAVIDVVGVTVGDDVIDGVGVIELVVVTVGVGVIHKLPSSIHSVHELYDTVYKSWLPN
jgi:hypothetical protein